MAHTKGHIKGFKNFIKPAKGITFTPFKAAYSLGKTALKHPLITAGLFSEDFSTSFSYVLSSIII